MSALQNAAAPSEDYAEHLGRIDLFRTLRPEALDSIRLATSRESYHRGEAIFRHGDVGDRLYLILEGKIRISRNLAGMGEEALAVLGPGEAFGEMALLDEAPRSADAIAHESCQLLTISKDKFDDLLFTDKGLAYEVLWSTVQMLVGRLRETNDKLTFLSTSGKF